MNNVALMLEPTRVGEAAEARTVSGVPGDSTPPCPGGRRHVLLTAAWLGMCAASCAMAAVVALWVPL
ncbi:hypothetical protein [Cupriavidus necator]|uniref:hypothetical protein n=1 Tax=Cupriavidus necator TaxID=106590 RepID=UPI0005B51ADD|nr:hypothetical protein [Cupriavidus necator]